MKKSTVKTIINLFLVLGLFVTGTFINNQVDAQDEKLTETYHIEFDDKYEIEITSSILPQGESFNIVALDLSALEEIQGIREAYKLEILNQEGVVTETVLNDLQVAFNFKHPENQQDYDFTATGLYVRNEDRLVKSEYAITENSLSFNLSSLGEFYFIGSMDEEIELPAIEDVQEEPVQQAEPSQQTEEPQIEPETNNVSPTGPLKAPSGRVTSIDTFGLQFVSGAELKEDKLVWTANRNTPGHSFVFRLVYSTSGIGTVAPETYKIYVPKHILKERTGGYADEIEFSVIHESEYVEGDDVDFVYREEETRYVIYNIREISSAENGYFELSYSTNKNTINYADMGVNDKLSANIEIGDLSATTNELGVYIDTSVKINSTEKRYPRLYKQWNSSWGTQPADASDYYYLVWELYTRLPQDITQPYNLTFTDTISSSFGTPEVVGYKFSGQSQYQASNVITNQRNSYSRYDYVLTRHAKAEFEELDAYAIKNDIKIDLQPADLVDPITSAVSQRTFLWERPFFKYPSGKFQIYKRADGSYRANQSLGMRNTLGLVRGKYTRYDLDKLKEGRVTDLDNFDYGAWLVGYPYSWTVNENADKDDPASYGVEPVTYTLVDDKFYLSQDGGPDSDRQLTYEDYEIYKINYAIYSADADFSTESQTFVRKDADYLHDVSGTPTAYTAKIYLKFQNSDYVEAATINLATGEVTPNNTYITTIDNRTIVPKENCVGYKIEYTNPYYYTEIDTVPYVKLKNSSYVMSTIASMDSIAINNIATSKVTDYKGTEIYDGQESDKDFARVTQRDSYISKDVVSTSNNKKKKVYAITWRIDAYEQMTMGQGDKEYLQQSSGEFFDLLPKGMSVSEKSIAVKAGDQYLNASDYEYERVVNYQNTGRELFKVSIKEPGDKYTLYFDTLIDWDGIKDFGTDVYNPIGYKTGNDDIKNGTNDDGGSLKEKTLMSNMTQEDDGNTFIYSDEYFDIVALTSATAGLSKKVKALEDETFTDNATTSPNGMYQYRLRYMALPGTKIKDIVFYDSLENYVVIEEDNDVSDWHGLLNGIDLSQVMAMGCQPVVYLSRLETMNIPDYKDLDAVKEGQPVWIQADEFGDISQAKAIAIDLRKKSDETDFVLNETESVNITLTMKTPASATSTKTRVPVSYNNIYVSSTVIDSFETEVPFFIHHDYTTVNFIVQADIRVNKISSEDSKPIRNIKFRLWGTSAYGNEIDVIESTDRNGNLVFKNIEQGTYILAEHQATPDWIEDHTEHTVIIDSYGNVTIDGNSYENNLVTLTNDPRVHANITILKKELNTDVDLQFAPDEWNPDTMTKYAVALYGIGQDKDEDGNEMGLTFGPATGASYMTTYKSHTPSGTTSAGNEHHCIHEDSWEEIVYWNLMDPYVYEQCIEEGCTHSVNLSIEDSIVFGGTKYAATGDGPSILYNELLSTVGDQYQHLRWNPINNGANYGTNKDGWGASRVRAMLNGADDLTMTKGSYSYYNNLNITTAATDYEEDTSLIAAFPEVLKMAIGSRKTAYNATYNKATVSYSYDKLFLLSQREISTGTVANYRGYEGTTYSKFASGSYSYSSSDSSRIGYKASGKAPWWLRSPDRSSANYVYYVDNFGRADNYTSAYNSVDGISPCFSLTRSAGNISASLSQVSEGNTGDTTQESIGASLLQSLIAQQASNANPSLNGLIANTTFRLWGVSDYGTEVSEMITSGEDGLIVFQNIEKGTYKLKELKAAENYLIDENEYTITIDENGNISSDLPSQNGRYLVNENEPRYWNFFFRKVDATDNNIWLEGATFTLDGTSDLGTEYHLTVQSDENGKVEFTNIEKGTYIFKETQAPTGVDAEGHIGGSRNYATDTVERILTIDGTGKVKVSGLSLGSTGEFYIPNDRALDGQVIIYKHWNYVEGDTLHTPIITLYTTDPSTRPTYTLTYDANGGHFEDNTTRQTIYVRPEGSLNIAIEQSPPQDPTGEEGFQFLGWTTEKDGSTYFSPVNTLSQNTTIYAKWKDKRARYAVSLYGIGQDIDEYGNTMGLTFGPAIGGDYVNSFKSHTPSGDSETGNAHRCIHNDTWEEIVYWNSVDPEVYEECIAEGCTKSVPLNISSTLKNAAFVVNYTGDGPGMLYNEFVNTNAVRWNAWGSSYGGTGSSSSYDNTGGWGVTNVRAVLNGVDDDDSDGIITTADTFARTKGLTESTALIGAFPEVLRNAIGRKAVKYDSVYNSKTAANLKTTYDKLWLLSSYEMGDGSSITSSYYQHPLEALDGSPSVYQKFISGKITANSQTGFVGYRVNNATGAQSGAAFDWWLRSVSGFGSGIALSVGGSGSLFGNVAYNVNGLAPCFSLAR